MERNCKKERKKDSEEFVYIKNEEKNGQTVFVGLAV